MLDLLKNLFGTSGKAELKKLLDDGVAVLLDVRTKEEYRQGHADPSINIPLDTLVANLSGLDRDRPIVAVCQSGMRSGSAVSLLKRKGFKDVYNGGCWASYK